MKGKIFALLLCATIALGAGVSVAYYNTRTFGFDRDAKVVEKFDDRIKILDFDIYYDDANKILEKAIQYVPKTHSVVNANTL